MSGCNFTMPAEFDRHSATVMIWPERPGSWGNDRAEAEKAFLEIISAIAADETVYLCCTARGYSRAEAKTRGIGNVRLMRIDADDSWARDTSAIFVRDTDGHIRGTSWKFNAWGGLYEDCENDNALAGRICDALGYDCRIIDDFVLEGGSIHSDGEGTLLVTECCLLNPNRNPGKNRREIEEKLCTELGASKVIWLPYGIFNDETDGHVDNICAFVAPAEVILAWSDNKSDPQYALSAACLDVLEHSTDAKGRPFTVHKLPVPDIPVCITSDDCRNLSPAEGEAERTVGERLAASYVNFYFTNKSVILPQFGGENSESDKRAAEIIGSICKGRKTVPVYSRPVLVGGGNIHCITSQIPYGIR